MKFTLNQVGLSIGAACQSDTLVTGWSVDSRTAAPGDLFFALHGPNHDGHDHVEAALAKGAVAAVVERDLDANGILLRVPDVLKALQDLASWARRAWGGEVIGVTGSAGKTTTKDIIAAVLSSTMTVGKTIGNLNNHVGLPLSILRLPEDAKAAVLELGMNHAGEIRDLSRIAAHRIAVVTNAGSAHIENFESLEGVAAAKRELVEALPPDGIAILNADDPAVARFGDKHPGHIVTYGIDSPAAGVRATNVVLAFDGSHFEVDGIPFSTGVAGRHNVLNILSAIAAAGVLGIPTAHLQDAIARLEPPKMRGERRIHNGVLVIDDCYNSNPDAARAMLDFLVDSRAWRNGQPPGRAIAVLGEMRELGSWSAKLHGDVGRHAAVRGVEYVVGVKGDARFITEAAQAAGLQPDHALFAAEPAAGGDLARQLAKAGDVVLFKGSRGTKMELALGRFLE